jgi:hypothetical protein
MKRYDKRRMAEYRRERLNLSSMPNQMTGPFRSSREKNVRYNGRISFEMEDLVKAPK